MDLTRCSFSRVYLRFAIFALIFGFIDAQKNRVPQKWTDGIVPYKISKRFAPAELKLILESLAVISEKTCVKFKPFKGETSFIQISLGMQCQSAIGRTGGAQSLLLARNCLNQRSILRELMHVLGFNDEHLRSDRDQFITVNLNNVGEGDRIFFEKLSDQELPRFGLPYDYDSVLQVPANWKVDPKASPSAVTIVPKAGKGVSQLGRSQTLTHLDINKISSLYGCK
ncbi:hypothetical protein RvY_08395 [Ramazzottius varieornatus]|uniref:Metalloendopeptidase n=1 Tax=Ramazzottius varieornatus TaxID=947166 RepID=A0A1D1VAA3_RAMVA|nr:hypothetical protein RvY_08395 [Ramazzottius varieornatus]